MPLCDLGGRPLSRESQGREYLCCSGQGANQQHPPGAVVSPSFQTGWRAWGVLCPLPAAWSVLPTGPARPGYDPAPGSRALPGDGLCFLMAPWQGIFCALHTCYGQENRKTNLGKSSYSLMGESCFLLRVGPPLAFLCLMHTSEVPRSLGCAGGHQDLDTQPGLYVCHRPLYPLPACSAIPPDAF